MSYGAFLMLLICFSSPFLVSCGPLIDLCRGPHVRHTGKIKAMKIYKVKNKLNTSSVLSIISLFHNVYNFYSSRSNSFSLHSVNRTRQLTGRAVLTWRLCRGSTGSLSQIPRCWRNGSVFRRRPRIETIARLAKWVTALTTFISKPTRWRWHAIAQLILIQLYSCVVWWMMLWALWFHWCGKVKTAASEQPKLKEFCNITFFFQMLWQSLHHSQCFELLFLILFKNMVLTPLTWFTFLVHF